jgi:LysM repeat protein
MESPHPSTAPAGRRLVGLLAVALSAALIVVDGGYAPAAQSLMGAQGPSVEEANLPAAPAEQEPSPDAATQPAGAQQQASGPNVRAAGADLAGGTHVVSPGETLGVIAERYGVSSQTLARANRNRRADVLRPGDRLVVPDPDAPRPYTPEQAMAADLEVEGVLEEVAVRYGWNPATVKAVAWYESRWNQHLVSSQGAIGVMQVQPDTGELMAPRVGRPLDLHDLHDNIEAGVAYLDHLYGVYSGDLRALIAAYHQGPQAVSDRGIYGVSDVYADEVLRLREVFRR